MIVELTIENIALIERAHVCFASGMTALSGETGAGKSLVLDALGLALGGRSDAGLLRKGAESGLVGVTLNLSRRPALAELLLEHGVSLEDDHLFLERQLTSEGRSVARINGRQVPVQTLRQVGRLVIQVHSQHDTNELLASQSPRQLLDLFLGEEALELQDRMERAWHRLQEGSARLQALRTGTREREQRLDVLRHQLAEIEDVAPVCGEYEELSGRLSRAKHATQLIEGLEGSAGVLDAEGDGALDQLATARKMLERLLPLDPTLGESVQALGEAHVIATEAMHELRRMVAGLDFDPQEHEIMEERASSLQKLRRKYGDTEAQILEFATNCRRDLAMLEDTDADLGSLETELSTMKSEVENAAQSLSSLRRLHAQELAGRIQAELHDLGLPDAQFVVAITHAEVGPHGCDHVAFEFSAHATEPLRDLAKVASGGELARIMLAVQTVLASVGGVPTLIFDEIDSGLSGRAASAVGRKLHEISKAVQVVAISHLPQVVSQADQHFHLDKEACDGSVRTRIEAITGQRRVEEVARLLSGERIGPTALQNAEELLATG